jgi:hypothetical protein
MNADDETNFIHALIAVPDDQRARWSDREMLDVDTAFQACPDRDQTHDVNTREWVYWVRGTRPQVQAFRASIPQAGR